MQRSPFVFTPAQRGADVDAQPDSTFVRLRRLGEGASGVVFEADDTWIGRRVALIALRWLGHYPDAERRALEAYAALPKGSTGWYGALGHVAMVGGSLGKNDRFLSMIAELSSMEGTKASSARRTSSRV